MSKRMLLKGKIAIVTGAGAGIGRSSAILLARAGAIVVVCNDKNIAAGNETMNIIKNEGGESTFIQTDVSNNNEVQNLIIKTKEIYGGLDILFCNAGITNYIDLEEMPEEEIDRIIGINLKGSILCAKYSLPLMRARGGGSIIFCSSVLNTIGFPQCVVYSATKGGQISAARTLAVEVGKYNIRVNTVSPGTINTPMLERDMVDMNVNQVKEYTRKVCYANALGRIGEPEEVARAVVWLSSDEASYITGANLYIDGAFTAVKRI
jgi:NAD(P)-dependent dehydrogenase (short-subunit alcohol dehydrogenase family)